MRHLLCGLFFLLFLCLPNLALAADTPGVQTGVQLPSAETIKRLIPSQYGFQWLKYQFQLGTDTGVLTNFISATKAAPRGRAGTGYKVLISVAKNAGADKIEALKNPVKDYPVGQKPDVWSKYYCPWDEELETYDFPYDCGSILLPATCVESIKAKPYPNGYLKFRDKLNKLAPFLQNADAVEIWNEPNLTDEWTDEGLGPLNAENYANFLNCGVKGLKKGGYGGKIISAAPSPNAPNGPTSLETLKFFDDFIKAGGISNVDYIGWHSNVTADIKPSDSNPVGFQGVKYALDKGKPVWITEFGWQWNKLSPAEIGFNTEEQQRHQQSKYITDAYKVASELGNISGMAVFNFGFYKETGKFQYEDIEGTTPEGLLCQPNVQVPRQDYGDTSYVQDVTLRDDASWSAIIAKALIPEVVNQDIALKTGQVKMTNVEVVRNFFDNIRHTILKIWCLVFSNIPILNSLFSCEKPIPNISIGLKETEDAEGLVPGQNTATLSATAKILGAIAQPGEMERVAEDRDCNLGNPAKLSDPQSGESRLVDTSAGLGTGAGFYGVDIPDFKTLSEWAKSVWEASMSARMVDQNLNITNKLFSADRRTPDLCLRLKTMVSGFYPEAVFPESLTCDQLYDIFLKINQSQFSRF